MFFCLVNSKNGTLQQLHTTGMSFRIYTVYPQSWTKTKGVEGCLLTTEKMFLKLQREANVLLKCVNTFVHDCRCIFPDQFLVSRCSSPPCNYNWHNFVNMSDVSGAHCRGSCGPKGLNSSNELFLRLRLYKFPQEPFQSMPNVLNWVEILQV